MKLICSKIFYFECTRRFSIYTANLNTAFGRRIKLLLVPKYLCQNN